MPVKLGKALMVTPQGLAYMIFVIALRLVVATDWATGVQTRANALGSELGRRIHVSILHETPHVVRVDGLLTDAECASIIEEAERSELLQPSRVKSDHQDEYVEDHSVRSSFEAVWAPDGVLALSDDSLPVIAARRLHRIMGEMGNPDHLEGPKVVRYDEQQFYAQHHDFFSQPDMHPTGQRLTTALLYLSSLDADDGGCTVFPRLGNLRVVPQAGSVLIWRNTDSDGLRDYATLHGSEPLQPGTTGKKWIVNFFYRQGSYYQVALKAAGLADDEPEL